MSSGMAGTTHVVMLWSRLRRRIVHGTRALGVDYARVNGVFGGCSGSEFLASTR